MGFWAYMLHCADRTFYVGHTEDLDARIGAHQSGLIRGYTSTRLPVTLVWADEFPTRYEALQAERQIKGWSRAKKLALIRRDWQTISDLARNSEEKERASTSSARTEDDRSDRPSGPAPSRTPAPSVFPKDRPTTDRSG